MTGYFRASCSFSLLPTSIICIIKLFYHCIGFEIKHTMTCKSMDEEYKIFNLYKVYNTFNPHCPRIKVYHSHKMAWSWYAYEVNDDEIAYIHQTIDIDTFRFAYYHKNYNNNNKKTIRIKENSRTISYSCHDGNSSLQCQKYSMCQIKEKIANLYQVPVDIFIQENR